MASPPASRVDTSWKTETQVFVAVFVVNGLTLMPVFLVKAVRHPMRLGCQAAWGSFVVAVGKAMASS